MDKVQKPISLIMNRGFTYHSSNVRHSCVEPRQCEYSAAEHDHNCFGMRQTVRWINCHSLMFWISENKGRYARKCCFLNIKHCKIFLLVHNKPRVLTVSWEQDYTFSNGQIVETKPHFTVDFVLRIFFVVRREKKNHCLYLIKLINARKKLRQKMRVWKPQL
jgi:hypothetical protein